MMASGSSVVTLAMPLNGLGPKGSQTRALWAILSQATCGLVRSKIRIWGVLVYSVSNIFGYMDKIKHVHIPWQLEIYTTTRSSLKLKYQLMRFQLISEMQA